jgi:histidinol-phosphate aminotransferase
MAGAAASIKDDAYFRDTRDRIIETREITVAGLREMGYHVIDSKANFIFAAPPSGDAAGVYAKLREKGILVRYFNKPRIDSYLRISIGSEVEMAAFLNAVEDI